MIVIRIGPWFVLKLDTTTGEARAEAHAVFDALWKDGEMSRNAAYRWLSERLGMTREECHMSRFDEKTCRRVVEVCKQETKRLDRRLLRR